MFVKEYDKFRKDVEKTIYAFFKLKPEELESYLDTFHKKYDRMYDLNKVSYKDIAPELREELMLYKTMNYFYNIWVKLNELEPYITDEARNLDE
jgi:uncharacterized protein YueI